MHYFNFNLSEYKLTKYSFIYFDLLFKNEINTKESIIKDLKIVYSTYRKCKNKEQEAGVEIVNRLNKYFNINNLDVNKIPYYENLLSRTIEKIYYREKTVYELELKELEECINENNILKTVFQLFKLYINMTDVTKSRSYIVELLKNDYQYVKERLCLLSSEILPIYYLAEIFYEPLEKLDINKLDIAADNHPYIKGLLYPLISTKYFTVENYDKSLIYALKAKKVLEREYNFNRLISITNNITNLYLHMKQYHLALDTIKNVVPVYYRFNQDEPSFINFKSVYYASLYFNDKIDEIIYSINRCKKLHNVDYLFKAICSIKKGNYDDLKIIKEECEKVIDTYKTDRDIISLIYNYYVKDEYKNKKYKEKIMEIKNVFKRNILLDLVK